MMRMRFGRGVGGGVRHHPFFVTLGGDRLFAVIGAEAATLGATSLAIPAFSITEVADRVTWARAVLAHQ